MPYRDDSRLHLQTPTDVPECGEEMEMNESVMDFDSVASMNNWTRLQNSPRSKVAARSYLVFELITYLVNIYFFIVIVFNELVEEGVDFHSERRITFTILVNAWFLNLFEKVYLEVNLQTWSNANAKDIGKLMLECGIFHFRPARSVYNYLYWLRKKAIVGRTFVHGETVTRKELDKVTEINKLEVKVARDDVYESFIQDIPMCLVQYYFFVKNPSPLKVCSMRDVARLLYIFFHLIGAVRAAFYYDWKKRLCTNSLHVQGYLATNGRFRVPHCTENRISLGLKLLYNTFAIFANFFLIGYMSQIHWVTGVVCAIFLFLFDFLITFFSGSALEAAIENLPEGITLTGIFILDRWVNVFTPKDTRFHELSREPADLGGNYKFRYPLVLIKVYIFSMVFIIIYAIVSVLGDDEKPRINFDASNTTYYCKHHNPKHNPFDIFDMISVFLVMVGDFLKIGFKSVSNFYNFFGFHWILLYAQFICAFALTYYTNKYFEIVDRCYPVMLAFSFFKQIMTTIMELPQRDNCLKLHLVKRLIYLMSIDLRTFDNIYRTHFRISLCGKDMEEWWNSQMFRELQRKGPPERVSHRYFELELPPPDIHGLPISDELERVENFLQTDPVGHRLFLYFGRRLDRVMSLEMTSDRIEKTLGFFQMPKGIACVEMMSSK